MFRQLFRRLRPAPACLRSRVRLGVEQLECRLVPATRINATTVTYQDVDGDTVKVVFSKPILTDETVADAVFAFNTGTVSGNNLTPEQLQQINLTAVGAAAALTKITVTATRSAVNGGDGFANVGFINAVDLDVGAVKIDGDLGQIDAGNDTAPAIGLAKLTVKSLGRYGLTTQTGGDLLSSISDNMGPLTVQGDVVEASVFVQGNVSKVTVAGSLIGGAGNSSGAIEASGTVGPVLIGGDLVGGDGGGSAELDGDLTRVTVKGSLRGGSGVSSARIHSATPVAVKIHGSMLGGSGSSSGGLQSRSDIIRLTVGGSIIGGTGDGSGSIDTRSGGSGRIGPISIGGDLVGGSVTGTENLERSGVIISDGPIASVFIGGSVIAGVDTGAGTLHESGKIHGQSIGSLVVNGSLVGNATNPVQIVGGQALNPTATRNRAIGSVLVKQRVEFANILAGYGDDEVIPFIGDAQIGPVTVRGDWIASNLVAGVDDGPDHLFGTADDEVINGGLGTPVASISRVTIGGRVLGTFTAGDHFGIVAQQIGALRIGGITIPLTTGASNDDRIIGTNDLPLGDVKLLEVP